MRVLPWVFFLLISGLAVFFIIESNIKDGDGTVETLNSQQPVVIEDADIYDYESSDMLSWIKVKKVLSYEKSHIVLLFDINAEIYSDRGKGKPAYIKADFGKIYQKTKRVHLSGNLIADMEGKRLETEELILDHVKKRIYNQKKVWVYDNKSDMHAESMIYDIKSRQLRLNKVEVKFKNAI
ncbi:MAG: LPS export ABC transporter periplasmic protein LptC [Deltaproteobacteria bacterium]|nr:LPS export ABC transporter periplasmic protein LptC [Deltaproteobacteria bacterium]